MPAPRLAVSWSTDLPLRRLAVTWGPRLLGIVVAALLAARWSAALPSLSGPGPVVWLPAGVALAAGLSLGVAAWPAVLLAAVVAAARHAPWPDALVLGSAETVGAATAVWLLDRLALRRSLDRTRDLGLFLLAGGVVGPLLTATLVEIARSVRAPLGAGALLHEALATFVAYAAGAVWLGVPLLALSRSGLSRAWGDGCWRLGVPLAAGAVGCAVLALTEAPGSLSPLLFLPALLLGWLALHGGLAAASWPALGIALVATWAATHDRGPLAGSAALLWAWCGALYAVPLLLCGLAGELRAVDRRWRRALDSAHIGVADWDVASGRCTLSRRWLATLGHRAQTFGASVAAVTSRVHEQDREAFHGALSAVRDLGWPDAPAAFRMQCADGSWRWLEGRAVVARHAGDGSPARILLTVRDVSGQRAAEDRQQLSAKLFHHLHEGLLVTDAAHRVLEVNPAFTEITGRSRDEVIDALPGWLRPAEPGAPDEAQRQAMRRGLEQEGGWRGEIEDVRPDGRRCTLQVTISAVKAANGQVRYHAWSVSDITLARAQREQLERQAHTDELTGLPNRARVAHLLREAMREAEREGFLLTVCYLDLDHFKPVNDRHGHDVGDRLLVELAGRLRRSLRRWQSGDDTVARLGGDEFVLLLRTTSVAEARRAVDRVLRSVGQPYALGVPGGPVTVSASIGATVFPHDRADADMLLRHADHAMYGAKQAGRNGFLFFDPEHDRRTEQHFEAIGRVQDALAAEQFTLYYQPKVDLRRGRVLGVEALLRWAHPQHGVIGPAQFLPLIEHTELSARLGDWVLQSAIEQLAAWQRQGLDLSVSVNISARHLQEPTFAARLAALLARHPTPVGPRLVLEVLETAALADVDTTRALMHECRALGVRFALDDFGTGYSTFTYLKRLPLDLLKIDRSFVHAMLTDRQDLAIVEGVIGLSETFGCTVVAEGIETREQARRLVELGCQLGQGNGIAKAMPAAQVAPWVRTYRHPILGPAPTDEARPRPQSAAAACVAEPAPVAGA